MSWGFSCSGSGGGAPAEVLAVQEPAEFPRIRQRFERDVRSGRAEFGERVRARSDGDGAFVAGGLEAAGKIRS